MKYRADIDGLRSVAVIPVILFHLGYSWISGGYFGVDVFFVISGFLITSILLKEITTDSFSMKEFWLRRVRRILPAVITVILTVLFVAPFLIFRGDLMSLTSDALATLFSYANFQMLFKFGDYWGASAESSFFLHGWSLAVEEQFYIFYPLFLFFLYKGKKSWSIALAVLILVSLGLFLYGIINYPTATFYMLPTRAWELAAGGLIAVLPWKHNVETKYHFRETVLSILGLLMILGSFFIFTGVDGINFYAVLPVLGTTLIIRYSTTQNIVGKFLSSRPMVFIGKISYSLYLWHWPIIVLLHNYYITKLLSWQVQFLAITLTVLFSLLSYYFVENKTRRWKYTPRLVLVLIVGIIGCVIVLRSSFIKKDYDSTFDPVVFYGLFYDITPHIDRISEKNNAKREGIIALERDSLYAEAYKSQGIITNQTDNCVPQVVVLGDSHGAMWGKVIDDIAKDMELKASFYTSVGAPPFFDIELSGEASQKQDKVKGFSDTERLDYVQTLLNNLNVWRPKLLLVSCRWESISEEDLKRFADLIDLAKSYRTTVMILLQPPVIDAMGDKNSAQYFTFLGYQPNGGNQYIRLSTNHVAESNDRIRRRFGNISNVVFVDAYSPLVKGEGIDEALIIKDKDVLYYDDDHLSYQGTRVLKEKIRESIAKIVSNNLEGRSETL